MEGDTEANKICWVLRYIRKGSAEVWRENLIKNLDQGVVIIETVGKLFDKIREEFGNKGGLATVVGIEGKNI